LTHYPPLLNSVFKFSGNPAGWAFKCIASLVDELKPVAIVAGHVHELAGKIAEYNGPGFKSLVVFPGPQGGVLSIGKSGDARFEAFPIMSSAFERPSGLGFGISG
jgi:Icc-related predicted phosphoesterase